MNDKIRRICIGQEKYRYICAMIVAIVSFAPISSFAIDITTKSGKEYKDCSVLSVKPKGVEFLHASGVSVIPYKDLPDDIRSQYADQERKFAEKASRQATRRAEEQALRKISVSGDCWKVFQIIDAKTVLIKDDYAAINAYSRHRGGTQLCEGIYCLTDIDTQNLHDGVSLPYNDRTKNHSWGNYGSRGYTLWSCSNCDKSSPVFDYTKSGQVQAQKWLAIYQKTQCPGKEIVTIWRIGTYSYVSVNGSRKTIPKYTYSREKALKVISLPSMSAK